MLERFKVIVSVNLLFCRDSTYLLLRRAHTGWADGMYTLPAGHLNGGEQLTKAAAREAKEEVGVFVNPKQLQLVHIMHRSNRKDDHERLDFYFLVPQWRGEPHLAEPEKSDELIWRSIGVLPVETLENVRYVLESYSSELLSERNW